MNNSLYQEPSIIPSQSTAPPNGMYGTMYNNSEYAENILRNNVGKRVEAHFAFTDSIEWRDSIFKGILESSGKDYIIINDTSNNKRYLLWSVYINYIVFDENLVE